MLPSPWTSTYNYQFRDANTRLISPHQGEPMHHYNGHYDPSHSIRQHGYFGRSALLARAYNRDRASTANSANSASMNEYNNSSNNRTQGAQTERRYNPSFNGARASTAFAPSSSLSSSSTSSVPHFPPSSFRTSGYSTVSAPSQNLPVVLSARNEKDLWTHPILPHTGVYSDYTNIPGIHSRAQGTADLPDSSLSATRVSPSSSSSLSSRGEREPGYHIPGYQGFVRGIQFTHAETYGLATRKCLDVPTDVPLES